MMQDDGMENRKTAYETMYTLVGFKGCGCVYRANRHSELTR